MAKHEVPAAEFKARCLQLLGEVAATGKPLVITRRGQPIVGVLPVPAPQSLFGAMKASGPPTDNAWQAAA